jgi:Beta-galactosidase/beta-glucuronidase
MKHVFSLLTLLFSTFICSAKVYEIADYECYMNDGWQLESSSNLKTTGNFISMQKFAYKKWNAINIPSTVFSGLCQVGKYKDIYYSDNLEKVPTKQFNQSWWYRKEFEISGYNKNQYYELRFEGINYKANIWLNGKQIASQANIEGPFRMFNIDISNYASKQNVLAVEVLPPSKTDLTIGFVDWNPNTPDKNMGLWRGVKLLQSGKTSIDNVAISSKINLTDYSEADLTIRAELRNHSSEPVRGLLKTTIEGGIAFEIPYDLKGNEIRTLVLDKDNISALNMKHPRLWWPVNMGKPELYHAEFSLLENGRVSQVRKERFGIRQISDYTFSIGSYLHRGYKINGKKILIKGGGWVDDMCLADNDKKVRDQVEYVKHMNLNTIRLEGFWGNSQELYKACDENGILLMIGLSCQWEWESYCGRKESAFMCVDTDSDIRLVSRSFQDQVKWGMNNPSIFLWVFGSDKLPSPKLETMLNNSVRKYDTDRCFLSSCKGRGSNENDYVMSSVSGAPGSKMLGPYDYVPPVYWYEDTQLGGAYGFNTETGPGAQIPPIESLRKMLKPEDLPLVNGKGWQYHCGRNEFNTLDRFMKTYENRYWKDTNIEDFAFNVQMSNYEAIRAMFEAFIVNRDTQSTGVIQWMLNSAWPEMYWQLYDWFLNPNGAFYGTKAACQPVNLIYNYSDKKVYLTNESNTDQALKVSIRVLDLHSKIIFEKELEAKAPALSIKPLLAEELKNLDPEVYFLSLKLQDASGKDVSNNFYWLSGKDDVMDYGKSDWFYTPQTQFASFARLKDLKKVKVESECSFSKQGDKTVATVTLRNRADLLAFFMEMRIVDARTRQTILPVFWSDNYVSLLPGETRTFKAEFKSPSEKVELVLKGFNVE